MKKILCIVLMLWLPCFVMAASVMSMQMQLAEFVKMQPELTSVMADEMPCHHDHGSQASHVPAHPAASTHLCSVCGFCVLTNGIALLEAVPKILLPAHSQLPPRFLATPVYAQTYPPAIKPPIFM